MSDRHKDCPKQAAKNAATLQKSLRKLATLYGEMLLWKHEAERGNRLEQAAILRAVNDQMPEVGQMLRRVAHSQKHRPQQQTSERVPKMIGCERHPASERPPKRIG